MNDSAIYLGLPFSVPSLSVGTLLASSTPILKPCAKKLGILFWRTKKYPLILYSLSLSITISGIWNWIPSGTTLWLL